MGWSWYHAGYYKGAKVDRKTECDSLFDSELFEVLKSAMVGSTYYAAVRRKSDGLVFAAVTPTSTNMKDYFNFGYKGLTEHDGPYKYDCPKSILDLLSPMDSEWANEWREKCRSKYKRGAEI